jgi:hypothetical protein
MIGIDLLKYVSVAPDECGSSFPGISFEDYRMLAKTALSVPSDFMGIYPFAESEGCALDIFSGNRCLTIQVNSTLGHLCLLLSANIDCGDDPLCILSVGNSSSDWRGLGETARREIEA